MNAPNAPGITPDPILEANALGAPPWPTQEPFLFCVYHLDRYPRANERFGPDAPLAGRDIGQDFSGKDGWRMYHGSTVPGFPQHPHRGFETVTIARRGYIDHSDSLGAAARFGQGDVQWLTAGGGIVHAEMFPLFKRDADNPVELFQIWLNLPAKSKLAPPHFAMFWSPEIPTREYATPSGAKAHITVIAGALDGATPLAPPPHSWAADPANEVAIWTAQLDEGAEWTIPPARDAAVSRTLYFFAGKAITIDGRRLEQHAQLKLRADAAVTVRAESPDCELLLLQARPIGEPIAQYGPFVMNNRAELQQAFVDYQRTQFGGWPWPADDPVHERDAGRFARFPDGRVVKAP